MPTPIAQKQAASISLLYGYRNGQPSWTEEILCSQPERFEQVKALATKDGFTGFRIAKHVDGGYGQQVMVPGFATE